MGNIFLSEAAQLQVSKDNAQIAKDNLLASLSEMAVLQISADNVQIAKDNAQAAKDQLGLSTAPFLLDLF